MTDLIELWQASNTYLIGFFGIGTVVLALEKNASAAAAFAMIVVLLLAWR